MKCVYYPQCSGCSTRELSYAEQSELKTQKLKGLFEAAQIHLPAPIEFISVGQEGLRHRVDFTIEFNPQTNQHTTGFYDRSKNLLHIKDCLQLAPELQKIYSEFIHFKFYIQQTPLKKASVRLRVGADNQKGCWLDFSNIDIKNLLEDQVFLRQLLSAGFHVEIGQKGKTLSDINGQLKLTDPESKTWFKTAENTKLKCLVSDFTQPSWLSAQALVQAAQAWIDDLPNIKSILEFGPGIGQFTLPFLKKGLTVEAFEINESATEQLKINAQENNLSENLKIHLGDYHRQEIPRKSYELAFVNPARSGLKKFTEQIQKISPQYLIYVSCFPESMIEDLKNLKANYELCYAKIIDQFPQTEHFETAVLLKRKD